jgi:hypothetical protein
MVRFWFSSPVFRVACVILFCSSCAALGVYLKIDPRAPARAEPALVIGLATAVAGTSLILLFFGFRRLGRFLGQLEESWHRRQITNMTALKPTPERNNT